MNDPHIVALIYQLRHGDSVNYDNASPLEHDEGAFMVRVNEGEVRFEMKDHFASEEAAREAVGPFIRAWEMTAALERGPGEFDLLFKNGEIIDRDPTSGVVQAVGSILAISSVRAQGVVGRASYPGPPSGVAVNDDVEAMFRRYGQYREGKETLAGMAYFCLTVLEDSASRRTAAAKKYSVAKTVLNTLGRLTEEKGGADARKSKGIAHEFTGAERVWLDEVVKTLVRRAAEVEYDPSQDRPLIGMAILPSLEEDR